MTVTITRTTPSDEADWRRLWADYCAFYEVSLPEATVAELWRRILDPKAPIKSLMARDGEGRALGFANYVLHPHTWSSATLCYLEDLFTDADARGRGVGRALIDRLVEIARAEGWGRVYWHTHEGNATARALYDKVAGGHDGFLRYTVRP
ncbi:MAG TPA: GNAT family N-acetyltransferase [Azospirillaceae bacterium]|nr:GNAT family N-acetyltransferase [Azospirillaceae bacterium]